MNFKKQTKEEKAREILKKNNWFRDFYYVKKVIESCKNDDIKLSEGMVFNGTSAIINARKWGFGLLDKKFQNIADKYLEYRNEIFDIFYIYKEDLRNTYENVWEYVVNKMVEDRKNEIFK